MSHQQVLKKLRKEMRKDIKSEEDRFIKFLRAMSFCVRVKYMWRILWKP